MTVDEFRTLALALPATVEGTHMQHPDFRIDNQIFATLGPAGDWGMVKLRPEDQARLVRANRQVWQPATGAWGRKGSTIVHLAAADPGQVAMALERAWRCTAPPRLQHLLPEA